MAARKSGLGRGLEALIPAAAEEAAAAAQGVVEVPLASITPNPHQPRASIRDQDLVELAASIEEHGIIQPLVVNRAPFRPKRACVLYPRRRALAIRRERRSLLVKLPAVQIHTIVSLEA